MKSLELAPIDSTDCEMIRKWRNDQEIWQWTRHSDFISDADQRDWFESQRKDPATRLFKIAHRHVAIGVCGLTNIDHLHRRAEFSIYIGPEYQKRGYGRAALKLLLAHAFLNVGVAQVYGESFVGNPAIKLFEEIGFKKDGTRRFFYMKNGEYVHTHLFSILGEEWSATLNRSSGPSLAPRPAETSSESITPSEDQSHKPLPEQQPSAPTIVDV